MALFKNLTSEGHEENTDRLGGGGAVETGLYAGKIKVAYAGASQGGAQNVTLIATLDGGREYRETIYVTDKTGKNYYVPKGAKDGVKASLPGFTTIDDLCQVSTGAPLSEQETEEKTVNIYDFEAKKEMPKGVEVLTGLTGVDILVAIEKTLENKSVKNDSTGQYEPTADTREVNNIVKVFHPELRVTVPEAKKAEKDGTELKAIYIDAWAEKNAGQTRDKRTIKDGSAGTSGRPTAGPPAASGSSAPRQSLFGKK